MIPATIAFFAIGIGILLMRWDSGSYRRAVRDQWLGLALIITGIGMLAGVAWERVG